MADIKHFAKGNNELTDIRNTVKCFSDNIGMGYGLDQCVTLKKRRITEAHSIDTD